MGPWRKRDLRPSPGPGSFPGGSSEGTQTKSGLVWERETALIWPWGGPSLLVSVTWVSCLDVLARLDLASVLSISRWDFW